MDLKTLAATIKNAADKANSLTGPLEELASVASFLIPGSAGVALKEAVAVLKFIQAHEAAIGKDVLALAQDVEAAYAEFRNALQQSAPAPAPAPGNAPAPATGPGSKPE